MIGPVLIFRPEPGASATAVRARAKGIDPILLPLFSVVPRGWRAPAGRFDAVLMTSANAARHGGEGLAPFTHLPLYAVGEATGRAGREAGFAEIVVTGPDVMAALARLRWDKRSDVLHLAGEHRTEAEPAGLRLSTAIVYAAEPIEPPPSLTPAPEGVALLHSARAARRFAALIDAQRIDRMQVRVAAISANVAEHAGPGWRSSAAAELPSDEALLELAARMCD